jgi:predicted DNA-binding protein
MSTTTVRISEKTHEDLRSIANQTGEPMAEVLAKAIESYRRKVFMEQFNAAYAALHADSKAWQQEQDEHATWEATLGDGLEDY